MNVRLKRTPGIYLVGFMGCGKSTVGRVLADRLGWRFVDVDEQIEAAEGVAISHIFETRGEPEFRRIESQAILDCVRAIERGLPTVAALGGGAFAQDNNRAVLADNGYTIWLDCPFEIVQRRVAQASHRPLARDERKFIELYRTRRDAYAQADCRIAIEDDDPAGPVEQILALPILR
jgi:shikimate kinase